MTFVLQPFCSDIKMFKLNDKQYNMVLDLLCVYQNRDTSFIINNDSEQTKHVKHPE